MPWINGSWGRRALPQRRLISAWVPITACLLGSLTGCGSDETKVPIEDPFPAPVVGGTPETDAYAASPARCGMPDYTWRKDAPLGAVVASEAVATYGASVLSALAESAAMGLPELKYDVSAHLVTYTTQDRGALVDATTLIAWPEGVEDGASLPTLLLLHGTSGFTDGCGPSIDGEARTLVAALASTGYVVVAPDYIGLKATEPATGFPHPYLVGEATAIASLDAVRTLPQVAASLDGPGLARPSSKVVVVGGSQGGHAALWIDRLAPYYARELDIAGIAATVPPSGLLEQSYLALEAPRDSTGNLIAFYGASASWYGLGDRLDEVFVSPFDVDIPAALAADCDPGDSVEAPMTLEALFQPALLDAAQNDALPALDPWGCLLVENGLTTTTTARIEDGDPSYGILFITGEDDVLVDTPAEREAFGTLCNGGMPLTYLECAGASHTRATVWALPEILAFLGARVAGEPFAADCSVPPPTRCMGTPADE